MICIFMSKIFLTFAIFSMIQSNGFAGEKYFSQKEQFMKFLEGKTCPSESFKLTSDVYDIEKARDEKAMWSLIRELRLSGYPEDRKRAENMEKKLQQSARRSEEKSKKFLFCVKLLVDIGKYFDRNFNEHEKSGLLFYLISGIQDSINSEYDVGFKSSELIAMKKEAVEMHGLGLKYALKGDFIGSDGDILSYNIKTEDNNLYIEELGYDAKMNILTGDRHKFSASRIESARDRGIRSITYRMPKLENNYPAREVLCGDANSFHIFTSNNNYRPGFYFSLSGDLFFLNTEKYEDIFNTAKEDSENKKKAYAKIIASIYNVSSEKYKFSSLEPKTLDDDACSRNPGNSVANDNHNTVRTFYVKATNGVRLRSKPNTNIYSELYLARGRSFSVLFKKCAKFEARITNISDAEKEWVAMNTDDALDLFPKNKFFQFLPGGRYKAYQGDEVYIARTSRQGEYLTISNDSCTEK